MYYPPLNCGLNSLNISQISVMSKMNISTRFMWLGISVLRIVMSNLNLPLFFGLLIVAS